MLAVFFHKRVSESCRYDKRVLTRRRDAITADDLHDLDILLEGYSVDFTCVEVSGKINACKLPFNESVLLEHSQKHMSEQRIKVQPFEPTDAVATAMLNRTYGICSFLA